MQIDKNQRQFSESLKFAIDSAQVDNNGDIVAVGFATKEGVNLKNIDVPTSSYSWDGAFEHFKDMVLAYHRDDVSSVGKIESYEIVDGVGLKVRVRFFGDNDALFLRAIKERTLNGLSIGYDVLEFHEEADDHVFVFDKIKIFEISVVHIGANPEAVFAIVDSLRTHKTETNKRTFAIHKENQMSKDFEKQLDEFQPVLDELKSKVGDLQDNEKAREKLYVEMSDVLGKFNKGEVDESTMKTIVSKIQPMITEVNDKVNQGRAIAQVENDRIHIPTRDILSLAKSYTKDLDAQDYLIFNTPVDYKGMKDGERLARLRNMKDALYAWRVQFRAQNRDLGEIYNSDFYKSFVNETRAFSPELADAMAIGNTGFGAEWNPERWSSEMQDLVRAQGTWLNRLPFFDKIDKLPYLASTGKSYKGGEPTTDNPDRYKITNFGTGVTTPAYVDHRAAMVCSDLFTERSIVPAVARIRSELANSLVDGRSRGFLNGDLNATGLGNAFDTGRNWVAVDLETAHNSLRKYVFSTNTAVVRTAASEGVLALIDVRAATQLMGKKGIRKQDLIIIAPVQLDSSLIGVFDSAGVQGTVRTILDGQQPPIYGMTVYIDGEYPTDLNDTGVYDGSTTDREALLIVHTPSWGFFQERPLTLEMDKDIITGQWQFVGSAMWDIQQIVADPSGDYAAGGIEFL